MRQEIDHRLAHWKLEGLLCLSEVRKTHLPTVSSKLHDLDLTHKKREKGKQRIYSSPINNPHTPRSPNTNTMATMEAAAQRLLSPGEFDVSLLDQVMTAAYSPTDPNRAMANKVLMALQESPDVWTKADAILERAQNPQSRFFGLQVLDDAIRTRLVFDWMLERLQLDATSSNNSHL